MRTHIFSLLFIVSIACDDAPKLVGDTGASPPTDDSTSDEGTVDDGASTEGGDESDSGSEDGGAVEGGEAEGGEAEGGEAEGGEAEGGDESDTASDDGGAVEGGEAEGGDESGTASDDGGSTEGGEAEGGEAEGGDESDTGEAEETSDGDECFDPSITLHGSIYTLSVDHSSSCYLSSTGAGYWEDSWTTSCTAEADVVVDLDVSPSFSTTLFCDLDDFPYTNYMRVDGFVSSDGSVEIEYETTKEEGDCSGANLCEGYLGYTYYSDSEEYEDIPMVGMDCSTEWWYGAYRCRTEQDWEMTYVGATPVSEPLDEPAAAVAGESCVTDSGFEGIYNCYLECTHHSVWLGDSFCDPEFSCAELSFDEGACDDRDECVMDDHATLGLIDCDGDCSPDTRGDGICDAALDCSDYDYDGYDCAEVGATCREYSTTTSDVPSWYNGKFDCDLDCVSWVDEYSSVLGASSSCNDKWDCGFFGFDGGDCDLRGEACVTDDGSTGVVDCSNECGEPPTGDTECEERFACHPLNYDDRDCESLLPVCEAEDAGSELGAVAIGTLDGEDDSIHARCGSHSFEYMGGVDAAHVWNVPASGGYTFSLTDDVGDWSDKTISLYRPDCETFLACDAPGGTGEGDAPEITRYLSGGQAVVVMVDGRFFWSEGEYEISIERNTFDAAEGGTGETATGCYAGVHFPAGRLFDCSSNCVDVAMIDSWTSDDVCHDGSGVFGHDFNCEEFGWDGGACDEE